ncbi:Hint domain-containing protein [Tabrizicola sp. M-4]|uniref:Hint domain-containing protein n=1 Tax=Tabrizicola sp. M-4 TaxID=3055847 RepID=UPI003DA8BD00
MTVMQVNTSTTGDQSPPKMLLLSDGRVLHVWTDSALADTTAVELQARIFNADGTPATGQFNLGSLPAVDGSDGYDWDNVDLDLLPDGRVILGYVRSAAETGGDEPVFAILTPGPSSLTITNPATEIQSSDTTGSESPPVTTVLANGNVLFVWSNNALSDNNTTMHVEGRIFNPTTGSWVTNDFRIGNVAIDGTDGTDVPGLSVVTLAGGNVVVGWARSNAETGFNEPVYTVLDQNGATVFSTAEVEGTDDESQWTAWESPPVLHALEDGRWMALWINDGYSDDVTSMSLEGRIFNADGTPATGDFRIGAIAVDGTDSFDTDHLSIVSLGQGRVAISHVGNAAQYSDGSTHSHLNIIDTAADGAPIATDIRIPVSPPHVYSGPAQLAALGDSGYLVAVYATGNQALGGATGLSYRIFDANGNAFTGDVPIVTAGAAQALSGNDGFDWGNFSVLYNPDARNFNVAWVGAGDGSGTGAFSSGPIDVSHYMTDDIVDGTASGDVMAPGYADADGDQVDGGDGPNDSIRGNGGDDSIAAGAGQDSVDGGAGDDTVAGGAGNDALIGGEGADVLLGEADNDFLFGGTGNDLLRGGAGDDVLASGTGSDLLVLDVAGGNDTIGDFDFSDPFGTGRTNDQIDISELDDGTGRGITVWNTVVQDAGGGNARLVFPQGETLTLTGVDAAGLTPQMLHRMGIPCFTAGTPIDTPAGPVPVEALRPGDLVLTRDNGPQPLRWSAMRRLTQAELAADPRLLPVEIAAGALGNGARLAVSPQHAILLRDPDGEERLIRAIHLARLKGGGVRQRFGCRGVTYVHLMFDRHQVLRSGGLWSESFYPGPQALASLHRAALRELETLFPGLSAAAYGRQARTVPRFRDLPDRLKDLRPPL